MEPRFVQCAECGNRFDAGLTGFCPRCGATAPAPGAPGSAPPPALPPARRDPLRRRVQVGGILLAAWGALLAMACLAFTLLPTVTLSGQLGAVIDDLGDAPLPGGALHVLVLDNGTAARDATVEVRSPGGALLHNRTTSAGWANLTLGEHAAVNLTVRAEGRVLERRALVRANDTLEVRLDVARDEATSGERLGLDRFVALLRVGAAILGVGAALLLAGGVAAVAVRWPVLAIAGPIPVLALTVLLAVATLSVGMFVILLLQAVGVALIVSGRPAFRRR